MTHEHLELQVKFDRYRKKKITTMHFEIKSEKPILMPVMNWISLDLKGDKTEDELTLLAKEKMDEFCIEYSHISTHNYAGSYSKAVLPCL